MGKKIGNLCIFIFVFISTNIFAQDMFQTVEAKDATLVKTDSSKEFCNVCGMHLTKYYKTNHSAEFKNGHKEQYCSLHCLAEVHKNYEDKIKQTLVVDTNIPHTEHFASFGISSIFDLSAANIGS